MDEDESPDPDVVDAGDAAAVKRRGTRIKLDKRDAAAFWRQVFADPIGRSEMWSILTKAGAFTAPFAIGPNGFPQPDATWWAAGKAGLGQELFLDWMARDAPGVLLMVQENDPARFGAKPK